jgi:hypothetical protein
VKVSKVVVKEEEGREKKVKFEESQMKEHKEASVQEVQTHLTNLTLGDFTQILHQ